MRRYCLTVRIPTATKPYELPLHGNHPATIQVSLQYQCALRQSLKRDTGELMFELHGMEDPVGDRAVMDRLARNLLLPWVRVCPLAVPLSATPRALTRFAHVTFSARGGGVV